MERSQQLINAVQSLLTAQGFDAKPDDRLPDNPGVNLLIPLQEDGTELVFTELHFIEMADDFDVVQIYTTLIGELSDIACSELEKAIHVWNLDFLLGALAIHEDSRQLYHRYCVTLSKQCDIQPAAELVYNAFVFILRQIAEYHPDALILASGSMTFDELCAMD